MLLVHFLYLSLNSDGLKVPIETDRNLTSLHILNGFLKSTIKPEEDSTSLHNSIEIKFSNFSKIEEQVR